jgi:hypothetical protein
MHSGPGFVRGRLVSGMLTKKRGRTPFGFSRPSSRLAPAPLVGCALKDLAHPTVAEDSASENETYKPQHGVILMMKAVAMLGVEHNGTYFRVKGKSRPQ